METYGKMVFLSKEAENNFKSLSDREKLIFARLLARSICEQEKKIEMEMIEKVNKQLLGKDPL